MDDANPLSARPDVTVAVPPRVHSDPAGQQRADASRPSLSKFIEEIKAAFNARFYLFELEAKRAAWSAAYMLAFAVAAALLGVTAWLILVGALIVGAVSAGIPAVVAVLTAIALHAVAIFFLVRGIRSMVENLTFAATRRTLTNTTQPKVRDGGGA